MQTHPIVQIATPDDAASVAWAMRESDRIGVSVSEDSVRHLLKSISDKEVVLLAGLAVGTLTRYSDRGGYRFCAEVNLYMPPESTQEQGQRLAEALIEHASRFGYHHILARVIREDEPALASLNNAGFEQVGIQQEIGRIEERWVDVVVLQYVLEDVIS